MKKSLWLLLVVAALIAVFAVAGCLQGTTPEEPTEQPEEPTTPPADTACPAVVSTTVSKLYGDTSGANFQIKIVFDEAINPASCIYDPDNWTITIENSIAWTRDADGNGIVDNAGTYTRKLATSDVTTTGFDNTAITIKSISLGTDGKSIIVKAYVIDDNSTGITGEKWNYKGLICSENDVEEFIDSADGTGEAPEPNYSKSASATYYADKVTWKLSECAIADSLGNTCCTFSEEACCVEPTCVGRNCPLNGPGACYQ